MQWCDVSVANFRGLWASSLQTQVTNCKQAFVQVFSLAVLLNKDYRNLKPLCPILSNCQWQAVYKFETIRYCKRDPDKI